MLSRDDIMDAIAKGHLKIYPFEKKNLTGIGYNLSTTHFAFSINQGILLTIHQRITDQGVRRYVMIPKNDTVLFFSKEYIEVDRTLAGTFHSKVSQVCQGVGHISTTLDPTWKGQLILSVDNPTSKEIRFDVDTDSGNIMTMLLYQLDTEVTGEYVHNNNRGRCDLLLEHFAKPLPNKKYKNKHLQLEKFVVDEFANSLNGYDNFTGQDYPEDKYTQKVGKLIELRNRLEDEKTLIQEKRYLLGEKGQYYYFKNKAETELIQSCSLFEIKKLSPKVAVPGDEDGIKSTDLANAIGDLREYIDTINYELEMINHIRRINWQNEKINQFAGEESEFVRLRIQNEKITKYLLVIFLAVFFVGSIAGGWAIWQNYREIMSAVATIYAPLSVLFLQWWMETNKKVNKEEPLGM